MFDVLISGFLFQQHNISLTQIESQNLDYFQKLTGKIFLQQNLVRQKSDHKSTRSVLIFTQVNLKIVKINKLTIGEDT